MNIQDIAKKISNPNDSYTLLEIIQKTPLGILARLIDDEARNNPDSNAKIWEEVYTYIQDHDIIEDDLDESSIPLTMRLSVQKASDTDDIMSMNTQYDGVEYNIFFRNIWTSIAYWHANSDGIKNLFDMTKTKESFLYNGVIEWLRSTSGGGDFTPKIATENVLPFGAIEDSMSVIEITESPIRFSVSAIDSPTKNLYLSKPLTKKIISSLTERRDSKDFYNNGSTVVFWSSLSPKTATLKNIEKHTDTKAQYAFLLHNEDVFVIGYKHARFITDIYNEYDKAGPRKLSAYRFTQNLLLRRLESFLTFQKFIGYNDGIYGVSYENKAAISFYLLHLANLARISSVIKENNTEQENQYLEVIDKVISNVEREDHTLDLRKNAVLNHPLYKKLVLFFPFWLIKRVTSLMVGPISPRLDNFTSTDFFDKLIKLDISYIPQDIHDNLLPDNLNLNSVRRFSFIPKGESSIYFSLDFKTMRNLNVLTIENVIFSDAHVQVFKNTFSNTLTTLSLTKVAFRKNRSENINKLISSMHKLEILSLTKLEVNPNIMIDINDHNHNLIELSIAFIGKFKMSKELTKRLQVFKSLPILIDEDSSVEFEDNNYEQSSPIQTQITDVSRYTIQIEKVSGDVDMDNKIVSVEQQIIEVTPHEYIDEFDGKLASIGFISSISGEIWDKIYTDKTKIFNLFKSIDDISKIIPNELSEREELVNFTASELVKESVTSSKFSPISADDKGRRLIRIKTETGDLILVTESFAPVDVLVNLETRIPLHDEYGHKFGSIGYTYRLLTEKKNIFIRFLVFNHVNPVIHSITLGISVIIHTEAKDSSLKRIGQFGYMGETFSFVSFPLNRVYADYPWYDKLINKYSLDQEHVVHMHSLWQQAILDSLEFNINPVNHENALEGITISSTYSWIDDGKVDKIRLWSAVPNSNVQENLDWFNFIDSINNEDTSSGLSNVSSSLTRGNRNIRSLSDEFDPIEFITIAVSPPLNDSETLLLKIPTSLSDKMKSDVLWKRSTANGKTELIQNMTLLKQQSPSITEAEVYCNVTQVNGPMFNKRPMFPISVEISIKESVCMSVIGNRILDIVTGDNRDNERDAFDSMRMDNSIMITGNDNIFRKKLSGYYNILLTVANNSKLSEEDEIDFRSQNRTLLILFYYIGICLQHSTDDLNVRSVYKYKHVLMSFYNIITWICNTVPLTWDTNQFNVDEQTQEQQAPQTISDMSQSTGNNGDENSELSDFENRSSVENSFEDSIE